MKIKQIFNATPADIKRFIQGYSRVIRDRLSSDFELLALPSFMEEQILWRIEQIKLKSPECLNQTKCVKCGCDIPERAYADDPCEGNCYPQMMDEETWKEFKKQQEKS